jgi:hypothetical protein
MSGGVAERVRLPLIGRLAPRRMMSQWRVGKGTGISRRTWGGGRSKSGSGRTTVARLGGLRSTRMYRLEAGGECFQTSPNLMVGYAQRATQVVHFQSAPNGPQQLSFLICDCASRPSQRHYPPANVETRQGKKG